MSYPALNFPALTRRHFLKVGAVALAGFDLLPMVRPANVKAKEKVKPRGTADHCVFIFLQGGASQVDTFDIKEGGWTPPDFDVRTVKPEVRLPWIVPEVGRRSGPHRYRAVSGSVGGRPRPCHLLSSRGPPRESGSIP